MPIGPPPIYSIESASLAQPIAIHIVKYSRGSSKESSRKKRLPGISSISRQVGGGNTSRKESRRPPVRLKLSLGATLDYASSSLLLARSLLVSQILIGGFLYSVLVLRVDFSVAVFIQKSSSLTLLYFGSSAIFIQNFYTALSLYLYLIGLLSAFQSTFIFTIIARLIKMSIELVCL